jgi:hypothetical protein
LFPVFFWIFTMVEILHLIPLTILLSLQKIPLLCGLYSSNSSYFLIFLFSSFILGSLILFFSSNLIFMFLSSSISYSFIMFFLYTLRVKTFLVFFSIYSIFLFLCLSLLFNYTQDKNSLFFSVSCYMFFLGLPPLGLFFYKFIFSGLIYTRLGLLELFLFWSFSFLSLVGYVKFFYNSFFHLLPLYPTRLVPSKNLTSLFFSFFLFLSLVL